MCHLIFQTLKIYYLTINMKLDDLFKHDAPESRVNCMGSYQQRLHAEHINTCKSHICKYLRKNIVLHIPMHSFPAHFKIFNVFPSCTIIVTLTMTVKTYLFWKIGVKMTRKKVRSLKVR